MTRFIFMAFRKVAKVFSGYGLRDRFKFIDRIYKKINRGLAPSHTEVQGHIMFLDSDDSMGLAINGVYEPVETKVVNELVKPGMVVLDIGANIGYYTLQFAKLVGSEGYVFAFEPDPYSFGLLSKNIDANHYTNVSAFQLAASDRDSGLRLCRDKFTNLGHRMVTQAKEDDVIEIKGVKLDDFLPKVTGRSVDFIKMDIQGSEGFALEGMNNIIRRSNKISMLTEYWPSGLELVKYGSEKFLRRLENMGFELVDINDDNSGFISVTVEELTLRYPSSSTGHTNLLCRWPEQYKSAKTEAS